MPHVRSLSLQADREEDRLLLHFSDLLYKLMAKEDVSRTALARKLRSHTGFVESFLRAEGNPTLKTVAKLMCVLGYRVEFTLIPLEKK